jgi:hypothetical protein
MIRFNQGIKYQLTERTEWSLIEPIKINYSYATRWYGIDKDTRLVWAEMGCGWDGATMFPDFNWILEPSLRHDVLLWLIAAGAIPESENHLIDRELRHYIRLIGGPESRGRIKDLTLKVRSRYVNRATNLANTKFGQVTPIYEINYGKKTRIK